MELNEEGGVTEVSSDSDVLDENDCCDDYIDRPCKISSQENITWQDAGEDGTCSNWSGISSFFSNSRLSEDKNRRRSRRQEFFSLVKRRRQRGSLELRSTRDDEGVLKTAPFCMSAGSFAFRPYSSSCTTFKWCCNPCMRNGRTVDYETQYLLSAHLHALYHIFIEHVNDRERLLAETERRKIESELGFMLKFEVRSQENIREQKCFGDEISALSLCDFRLISAIVESRQGATNNEPNIYIRVCFCYKAFEDYAELCDHLKREHGIAFRHKQTLDFYPMDETSFSGKSLLQITLTSSGKSFTWSCFVCGLRVRQKSEVQLRLVAVYHLRNKHHENVRAMCIATNEKWFLENKFEVNLSFTPPSKDKIRAMQAMADTEIWKKVRISDERVADAIRHSATKTARFPNQLIVCFCYQSFQDVGNFEIHLRDYHSFPIPRIRRSLRLKRECHRKSSKGKQDVCASSDPRVLPVGSSKEFSNEPANSCSMMDDADAQASSGSQLRLRRLFEGSFSYGTIGARESTTPCCRKRFFWKCSQCSDGEKLFTGGECILRCELAAVLSLWAHFKKKHSKFSVHAHSLWRIIAAENGFPTISPNLKVIEEKWSPRKRLLASVACFECNRYPLFYFNDNFSLVVHLLLSHMMNADKQALDFLNERRDMEWWFPYLSVTHDDYFMDHHCTQPLLHCAKCEYKCAHMERLMEHALWHHFVPYREQQEDSSFTETDNSIINHFIVEEPMLEYTVITSSHPQRSRRTVGRVCRQCFSLIENPDGMRIVQHYYNTHREQLREIHALYCRSSMKTST